MNIARFFLLVCLVISFSCRPPVQEVKVQQLTPEAKTQQVAPETNDITCLVEQVRSEPSDPSHHVRITIQNHSGRPVRAIPVTPSIQIVSGNKAHYWSAITLGQQSYPLIVQSPSSPQLFVGARGSLSMNCVLENLFWANANSAAWPSQNFRKVVPPGTYVLTFRLTFNASDVHGHIESNPLEITFK